ncbi:hypothetical protein CHU92_07300 [Flavobacterium cyanobacteriorum]|uniref:Uncharacterized protein n=1 Tax=Flavobacterium cyanobacteriorum TaxID=2022802 RepID=A0A255Z8X8_9FLAO|nr:hypothetical protein CHU92_07300 [Flavobacterium cyanobacteriorum]
MNNERKTSANSTFAIGGVSCSADSFGIAESFVLRINISGKIPAHRKSAKRCAEIPTGFPHNAPGELPWPALRDCPTTKRFAKCKSLRKSPGAL